MSSQACVILSRGKGWLGGVCPGGVSNFSQGALLFFRRGSPIFFRKCILLQCSLVSYLLISHGADKEGNCKYKGVQSWQRCRLI